MSGNNYYYCHLLPALQWGEVRCSSFLEALSDTSVRFLACRMLHLHCHPVRLVVSGRTLVLFTACSPACARDSLLTWIVRWGASHIYRHHAETSTGNASSPFSAPVEEGRLTEEEERRGGSQRGWRSWLSIHELVYVSVGAVADLRAARSVMPL